MLIMFYKSPRSGTALAVLSRGWHPGEAAWAVHTGIALWLSATAPASLLQHTAPFVNLHCSRMVPWRGWLLSFFNAVFFCKSLMLLSRNTGKIKYLWGWKVCQDCQTVFTEKTKFLLSVSALFHLSLHDSSYTWWKYHEPFVFSVFD